MRDQNPVHRVTMQKGQERHDAIRIDGIVEQRRVKLAQDRIQRQVGIEPSPPIQIGKFIGGHGADEQILVRVEQHPGGGMAQPSASRRDPGERLRIIQDCHISAVARPGIPDLPF